MTLLDGCGAAQRPEGGRARPVDEDPVALLPAGAEGVLDVDVAQLRAWAPSARLRERLGERAGAARLDALGLDLLADLDLAAVAITGAGTETLDATLVARGRIDPARLRAALAASDGRAEEVEYHDARLVEGERRAYALITARTAVFGSRAEVRRAIDVASGNDEGFLRADGDRALRDAFGRVLEAKVGRPAVRAALRPTPALRERLEAAGVAGDLVDWVAAALAVGDGVDLGLVAGARDPRRAEEARRRVQLGLDDLKRRPALMLFGLARFTDDVQLALRREELHLAFRLDEKLFDRFLTRVERLVAAASLGSP